MPGGEIGRRARLRIAKSSLSERCFSIQSGARLCSGSDHILAAKLVNQLPSRRRIVQIWRGRLAASDRRGTSCPCENDKASTKFLCPNPDAEIRKWSSVSWGCNAKTYEQGLERAARNSEQHPKLAGKHTCLDPAPPRAARDEPNDALKAKREEGSRGSIRKGGPRKHNHLGQTRDCVGSVIRQSGDLYLRKEGSSPRKFRSTC